MDSTRFPQIRSSPAAPLRSLVASPPAPRVGSGRVGESSGSPRPRHLGEQSPGILRNVPRSGFAQCFLIIRLGCGWSALLGTSRHPRDLLGGLDLQHRVQAAWPGGPRIGALCPTRKLAASSEGTVGVRSPCAVSRDLTAVLLRGCRTHHGGHRVSLLSGDPPGSAWTDSLPRPPFPHCTPSL